MCVSLQLFEKVIIFVCCIRQMKLLLHVAKCGEFRLYVKFSFFVLSFFRLHAKNHHIVFSYKFKLRLLIIFVFLNYFCSCSGRYHDDSPIGKWIVLLVLERGIYILIFIFEINILWHLIYYFWKIFFLIQNEYVYK